MFYKKYVSLAVFKKSVSSLFLRCQNQISKKKAKRLKKYQQKLSSIPVDISVISTKIIWLYGITKS